MVQNNRFGKHKIKDPFKQATNSLFKIGGYLKTKDILIPRIILLYSQIVNLILLELKSQIKTLYQER